MSYEDAAARVVIRISNQTAAEGEAAGDIISGFENATGGVGNDALIGDGVANTLDGRAGNDYLDGGAVMTSSSAAWATIAWSEARAPMR